MPIVAAAVDLRRLPPDDVEAVERSASVPDDELRARDCGSGRATLAALRIAQIDEAVAREAGVQHDVAESALPAVLDDRHPAYVDGLPRRERMQLQHAALFRDEE